MFALVAAAPSALRRCSILAALALLAGIAAPCSAAIAVNATPCSDFAPFTSLPESPAGHFTRTANSVFTATNCNVQVVVSGAQPGTTFQGTWLTRPEGSTSEFTRSPSFSGAIDASGNASITNRCPATLNTSIEVQLEWQGYQPSPFSPTGASVGATLRFFVLVVVAAPSESQPTAVSLVGVSTPVLANAQVDAAALPTVTIADTTPKTYHVTWTFDQAVALVNGGSAASSFEEDIDATGLANPVTLRFGQTSGATLAFGRQGVFTVGATIAEASSSYPATATNIDTVVVYDPYSGAAASGKGVLNVATLAKAPKINFSISYRNGSGKGHLGYVSSSEGLDFSADTIGYLTVTGSKGISEGDGTLNGIGGWHYKLNVDGTTNCFQLTLTGPGPQYTVSATLSPDKKGDITVTTPPNG